ncbi:MAG: pyridoxal phosphate-dependent aminotransferase [Planctomycetia bacterium]|nr:pyridoxal phosphate-dependent aminotransferase [Planctomycetia bacterium]
MRTWIRRLIARTVLTRFVPGLAKKLGEHLSTVHHWSDDLLTADWPTLALLDDILREGGPDEIDFASGSPRFENLATTHKRLEERGLPPVAGLPILRGAVARYLAAGGYEVCPGEQILITPGAFGAVHTIFDAFVGRGEAVVLPDPVAPLYTLAARSAKVRWVQTVTSRKQLAGAMRGAKLLVVCSPNNPTGAMLGEAELEHLAWHARRSNVLILSDESFTAFAHDAEPLSISAYAPERTLVVGSVSHSHAMAWARVGWIAGPRPLVRACMAAAGLRGPFVSTTAQQTAATALGVLDATEPYRQDVERRRDYVSEQLNAMGLRTQKPAAGYFAWCKVPAGSGIEFARRIRQTCRVRLMPGELFGPSGVGRVRLTFGHDAGRLHEGLHRLAGQLVCERVRLPVESR